MPSAVWWILLRGVSASIPSLCSRCGMWKAVAAPSHPAGRCSDSITTNSSNTGAPITSPCSTSISNSAATLGFPLPSDKNHKFRDKPTDPWRPVHTDSQDRELEVFALAERLGGREAACLSSSFGGPQIMGFNNAICGYPSASAMAEAFGADQRWQVLGFYDFCKSNNLID